MADGKIPQGERYVQLNLKDMFASRRGGSTGGGSSNRGGSAAGRGGPIRNRPSGSSRPSLGSESRNPFGGPRDRNRQKPEERGVGGGLQPESASSFSEEDLSKSQSSDVEMYGVENVAVPNQGSSSMLRAAGSGGRVKSQKDHANIVVNECRHISNAVFDKHVKGYVYNAADIRPLSYEFCPEYRLPDEDDEAGKEGCRIRVLNADTFACAEAMVKRHNFEQSQMEIARAANPSNTEPDLYPVDNGVVVLNMANAHSKGGGFLRGSSAQEEFLMHRSTLWHTLPNSFYPLTELEAIYSPYVAIYKKIDDKGNYLYMDRAKAILDCAKAGKPVKDANNIDLPGAPLPEIAVITMAAIDCRVREGDPERVDERGYVANEDEEIMMVKIRQMLRIAALNGHRRLVLGAFGCGVFKNPRRTVATLFKKVLKEEEFTGGWWKEIIFGCYDKPGSAAVNFEAFHSILHGAAF